jgi:hypothetical protein
MSFENVSEGERRAKRSGRGGNDGKDDEKEGMRLVSL